MLDHDPAPIPHDKGGAADQACWVVMTFCMIAGVGAGVAGLIFGVVTLRRLTPNQAIHYFVQGALIALPFAFLMAAGQLAWLAVASHRRLPREQTRWRCSLIGHVSWALAALTVFALAYGRFSTSAAVAADLPLLLFLAALPAISTVFAGLSANAQFQRCYLLAEPGASE